MKGADPTTVPTPTVESAMKMPITCNIIPYNIIPYNTTPYNITPYSITPYNMTPYNIVCDEADDHLE